jgi:DNA topoisomerase-1
MDLVHAQQARQILDLLVGYKITPILWKCIAQPKGKDSALSAGRCQTPALKLIYDNEQDIKTAEERKVYNTTGFFTNLNIAFELNPQGKFETEDEMIDFLQVCAELDKSDKLIYTCSQPIKTFKKPPEPFTTSRLQQVASNELHYSPKETMRICQNLYEGGFITYMRTDSKTYSGDFLEIVKRYIKQTYVEGEKYISENIDTLASNCIKEETKKGETKKRKTKKSEETLIKDILRQEAHEAIRPTNISLLQLPETMDSKEKRMYKLIWENTLESCMTSASFYSVTASISTVENMYFRYTSELIDFPGWKIVAKKYSSENKEYHYLQQIKQTRIHYKKICSNVTIKGSKQHYTEARLIQLLEERGIGRPSTFSSLVDKIQERGYVKKEDIKGKEITCKDFELENDEIVEIETKREFGNEKSKLVIQQLGIIVCEFLDNNFHDLFNYEYTQQMEEALDKIAKGQKTWYELCKTCNSQIDNLINGLHPETKIEFKIDDKNTYIIGKYGPVVKCIEETNGKEEIKFMPVNKDLNLKLLESNEYTIEDVVDKNKKTNSHFILGQFNGLDVVIKKGKFGIYVSWGENSKTLKELGNRPIENITFDEVKKYLQEGSNIIREISMELSIRKGPKGDYLFYKNKRMKKPQFYDIKSFMNETKEDYKICDITILKSWITDKYNI